MKVALFRGPNEVPQFEIGEESIPKPKNNEIVFKVMSSALCGTDLHIIDGSLLRSAKGKWLAYRDLPIVIGHEAAGIVESVGKMIKSFKVGDRICTAPNFSCGNCIYCKKNLPNLCNNRGIFGLHAPGFHAEYGIANGKSVYKLPNNIDFDVGCLIGDTLGTAYHAINRVALESNDIVAIWGLGPIGIATAQMAKIAGASKVIAFDVISDRIEMAKRVGIDLCFNSNEIVKNALGKNNYTLEALKSGDKKAKKIANEAVPKKIKEIIPEGVDVSIEATGLEYILAQAFDATRKGGKILVVGIHSKPFVLPTLALSYREISLIGTFSHVGTESDAMINLLETGKIQLAPLISHYFPLKEVNTAYDLFMARKTNKVILLPDEDFAKEKLR
ncbi:MAG: alcohol dehydrogenase catalytic domain-containing protein [Candidatus Helarchaeota archaeon]|nr:alcohol dehydrogenase catalytic domain-containing protein [Candidatus Helarchaeota archaeon]